jgi:hypothetical protein
MYPDRQDGGTVVRCKNDPLVWRVHWLGKIMLPRFDTRLTAITYLTQLRQGKRIAEQAQ